MDSRKIDLEQRINIEQTEIIEMTLRANLDVLFLSASLASRIANYAESDRLISEAMSILESLGKIKKNKIFKVKQKKYQWKELIAINEMSRGNLDSAKQTLRSILDELRTLYKEDSLPCIQIKLLLAEIEIKNKNYGDASSILISVQKSLKKDISYTHDYHEAFFKNSILSIIVAYDLDSNGLETFFELANTYHKNFFANNNSDYYYLLQIYQAKNLIIKGKISRAHDYLDEAESELNRLYGKNFHPAKIAFAQAKAEWCIANKDYLQVAEQISYITKMADHLFGKTTAANQMINDIKQSIESRMRESGSSLDLSLMHFKTIPVANEKKVTLGASLTFRKPR